MTRLAGSFFTHDAQDTPFWREPARPAPDPGTPPLVTRVAVVGGGCTGLSAALTLARAGREVTVFEAEAPGRSASSRGAGMLGPGWATFDAAMAYGAERARAIVEESFAALDYVTALLARETIACDLAVTGCFRGAATPRIYDAMGRRLERIARAMPIDAHLVPRAEQRAEIGTDLYHGGLVVPGCAGLHPARYVAGLAAAARRAGAFVVSGARVIDLRREAGGFVVATAGGETRAGQVLVATNGSTGGLVPDLRRRPIPVRSAMIATEPLPQAVMARLSPRRRMFAGSSRLATCFRSSPDGRRILFGGLVPEHGNGPGDGRTDARAARTNAFRLRRRMLRVFPELEQNLVSHYWHGGTAFTFERLPHSGATDGLFVADRHGGTGIARETWLGHVAARRMMGDASEPTAYEDLPFRTRSFDRGPSWFLPIALALYELMDRWDAR